MLSVLFYSGKTYIGRAFNDKWRLMHQLTKGEVKMRTSHLKLKDGKIFMLTAFEIEKEKHRFRAEVVTEASLSLEYTIMVKIGKAKLSIGSREEFLYRKLAIQAARKRTRKGVKFMPGLEMDIHGKQKPKQGLKIKSIIM